MEPNDTVNATNADEEGISLRDVLTELRAWRNHANRKEAMEDERFLRSFTDMGEVVTTVQQRTEMYNERGT